MSTFDDHLDAAEEWFASGRFEGLVRLYSPRQVAEQQGTVANDYPIARGASEAFYARLRELFSQRKSMTTFGPYSPGQAVAMKRLGLEGHLSRWLGDFGQGLEGRRSRGRSGELSAGRCPRRGRAAGSRLARGGS